MKWLLLAQSGSKIQTWDANAFTKNSFFFFSSLFWKCWDSPLPLEGGWLNHHELPNGEPLRSPCCTSPAWCPGCRRPVPRRKWLKSSQTVHPWEGRWITQITPRIFILTHFDFSSSSFLSLVLWRMRFQRIFWGYLLLDLQEDHSEMAKFDEEAQSLQSGEWMGTVLRVNLLALRSSKTIGNPRLQIKTIEMPHRHACCTCAICQKLPGCLFQLLSMCGNSGLSITIIINNNQ